MELSKIEVRDGAKLDVPAIMNLGSTNTKSLQAREGAVALDYDPQTGLVRVQIVAQGADRDYYVPREAIAIMYPAPKRPAASTVKK